MAVTSGSRAARERTAVDLAVPFLPRISTPPMRVLTALRINARFIAVWPTMAVKGKRGSAAALAGLVAIRRLLPGRPSPKRRNLAGAFRQLPPPQGQGDARRQQRPHQELAGHR